LANIVASTKGMKQKITALDNKSSPQMRTPVSDQLSAQPPISGRNTTLVAAKDASTRPTSNGVPPKEVM
jgi:hypothetical protein